jgi:hypothetical protein
MIDYLLTGGIILLFILGGVCCIVWPRRMRWATWGLPTFSLSEKGRDIYTRGVGVIITALASIVGFFVIKNSF